MKPSHAVLIMLSLLLQFSCLGVNKEIGIYHIKEDQSEYLILECNLGGSEFQQIPELGYLRQAERITIDYVYSAFHESVFDQMALNEKRKANLYALLHDVNVGDIPIHSISQNTCQSRTCAQSLFHGFVIYYESSEILNPHSLPKQHATGHSDQDFNLLAQSGTKVHIAAGSFEYQDGTPHTGEYSFFIREAIRLTDIVMGGLITDCKEGILQSGGMLEVQANANGRPLVLKQDKFIELEVPTERVDREMKLYKGVLSQEKITWTQPRPLLPKEEKNCTPQIYHAQCPFNYSVIQKVEWEECQGIDWIRLTKPSGSTKYYPDTFSPQMASDYGLGMKRYQMMQEWFDNGQVDSTLIDDQFWGKELALEDLGRTDSVAIPQPGEGPLYYRLKMNFMSWVNIDKLMKKDMQQRGCSPVYAQVGEQDSTFSSMLIIPELRITLAGYTLDEENFIYRPQFSNTAIPLPNKLRVVIIGIKEPQDGRVAFDAEPLIVGQEEKVNLMLADMDLEQMRQKLAYELYPESRRR